MTRSKIQKIKCFVFFLIFLFSQIAANNVRFRRKRMVEHGVLDDKNESKEIHEMPSILSKEASNESKNPVSNTSVHLKKFGSTVTLKSTLTVANTTLPGTSTIQNNIGVHIPSMNSGALLRGIFVIIGLSVLVMAYMVFRSFRLNKTRTQMVRKYGVLAHRQDVEMRPLPLDEDDDDDTTVFDASSISSHRLQSQDS